MASDLTDPIPLPEPVFVNSSDEVRLAVYDFGGDGPDILFAHATGFCAGVFTPIIGQLGVGRVAALDFRGHGRSSAPATSMDWHGTAIDVSTTIETLDLDNPFAVGHSMGGAALILAEESRPGTFRGMWLFEPIIFPEAIRSTSGDNPLVSGALRRRATFDDTESAFLNFSSKPPFNALDAQALRAYVRDGFATNDNGSVSLRCRPEVESATYEFGPRHDAFENLDAVKIPVTILRGAEAPMSPSQLAPVIVEHLPNATLEDHPELGHFGPLENPESMARSIKLAVTALQ